MVNETLNCACFLCVSALIRLSGSRAAGQSDPASVALSRSVGLRVAGGQSCSGGGSTPPLGIDRTSTRASSREPWHFLCRACCWINRETFADQSSPHTPRSCSCPALAAPRLPLCWCPWVFWWFVSGGMRLSSRHPAFCRGVPFGEIRRCSDRGGTEGGERRASERREPPSVPPQR